MDAKSFKLVAEGHGTKNVSNTTNSTRVDLDTFLTVQERGMG
jgi:hypothetical protein